MLWILSSIWNFCTFYNLLISWVCIISFQLVASGLMIFIHGGLETHFPKKEKIKQRTIIYQEQKMGMGKVGTRLEAFAHDIRDLFGGTFECEMMAIVADSMSDILDKYECRTIVGVVVPPMKQKEAEDYAKKNGLGIAVVKEV